MGHMRTVRMQTGLQLPKLGRLAIRRLKAEHGRCNQNRGWISMEEYCIKTYRKTYRETVELIMMHQLRQRIRSTPNRVSKKLKKTIVAGAKLAVSN